MESNEQQMKDLQMAERGGDLHPRSLGWIERLVRIDTTSRVSNLGLIETVRDELRQQGLDPWLTYDAARGKANLFATVPAADGRLTGGTVLSGHTDVVSVDGQDWTSDPFAPEIREGKLYGRGTADMKGFIGTALTQIPDMLARRLRSPIHFALSFDEEVGCLGAPLMLAEITKRGIAPQGCIVGEPTSMEVVLAHKGINVYRCRVHGRASHSSLPQNGVNAIEYAARLICFIRDIADELRRDGPFDSAFDTPFSTAQTGVIAGGAGTNLIPQHCTFDFEFRNLPTVDAKKLYTRITDYAREILLPRMKEEAEDADIAFERLALAPAMEAEEEAKITALVRALARDTGVRKVSYGTEGGQFQEAGIPAIICGPGDILQAHRPDEFVALDQISRAETFLADFILANTAQ